MHTAINDRGTIHGQCSCLMYMGDVKTLSLASVTISMRITDYEGIIVYIYYCISHNKALVKADGQLVRICTSPKTA